MPPHNEDVCVTSQQFVKQHPESLRFTLLEKMGVMPWEGAVETLYQSKLSVGSRGSLYVTRRPDLPDRSTWFWLLDNPMTLTYNNYYRYQHAPHFKIKYVGCEVPPPLLSTHTLLRVSLSRWFKPSRSSGGFYLQISGAYD